uniref:Uncharacterized protein n=1 Tax=Pyxicephalus adspersus TaxID=30357 RepID=A0AAV3AGU6_PYXAD|nr:TPA: hypothetical protein GDO54_014212 [Pyxicephalus adspersus]
MVGWQGGSVGTPHSHEFLPCTLDFSTPSRTYSQVNWLPRNCRRYAWKIGSKSAAQAVVCVIWRCNTNTTNCKKSRSTGDEGTSQ